MKSYAAENYKKGKRKMQTYLRLVIHKLAAPPVYLEMPVDNQIITAIQTSKVVKVDLLFYDKLTSGGIALKGKDIVLPPQRIPLTEINDFKLLN